MTGRITVEVRDQTGTPMGLLRDWNSLEMVSKYCDIGAGKAELPASGWNRDLVRDGSLIAVVDAERGVLHLGPLTQYGETAAGDVKMQVLWKDGIEWMRRRLCYPAPGTPIPDGGALPRASDDRKGPTSTVIMGYVNANLGPGALAHRRLPGLLMGDDPGVGAILTASVQARMDNLLDLSRQLAVTGAVQFYIDTRDREQTFRVRQVENLSADVVFSARLRNLESSDFTVAAPTSTAVIVGGKGEDAERIFAEVQSPESLTDEAIFGRFETFRDDRSAEGDSLTAGALRDLAEKGSTVSAEFTPSNQALVYGTDYRLGDLVTCSLRPGFSVVKPVRQVTISVSAGSVVRVKPIAGDYAATASTGAAFTTRELVKVVNSLARKR